MRISVLPRNCSRRVLFHVAPNAVDLDIENCQFVLLSQLLTKMGICSDKFKASCEPIHACARDRVAVCLSQR
jgi:hypothetical protein